MFKVLRTALKTTCFFHALHHVTTAILTKGKEGGSDDFMAFFAMDNHMTTTILTKVRSGNLVAIFTKATLPRLAFSLHFCP